MVSEIGMHSGVATSDEQSDNVVIPTQCIAYKDYAIVQLFVEYNVLLCICLRVGAGCICQTGQCPARTSLTLCTRICRAAALAHDYLAQGRSNHAVEYDDVLDVCWAASSKCFVI
jgi:hypothetical protein